MKQSRLCGLYGYGAINNMQDLFDHSILGVPSEQHNYCYQFSVLHYLCLLHSSWLSLAIRAHHILQPELTRWQISRISCNIAMYTAQVPVMDPKLLESICWLLTLRYTSILKRRTQKQELTIKKFCQQPLLRPAVIPPVIQGTPLLTVLDKHHIEIQH